MYYVEKWPNILQKLRGVQTARFLNCVCPFFNIMYELHFEAYLGPYQTFMMKWGVFLRKQLTVKSRWLLNGLQFSQKSSIIGVWYCPKYASIVPLSLLKMWKCNLCENFPIAIQKLSHFQPMFHFYTPWKYQKIGSFLMFSGGIEVEHWLKMT